MRALLFAAYVLLFATLAGFAFIVAGVIAGAFA